LFHTESDGREHLSFISKIKRGKFLKQFCDEPGALVQCFGFIPAHFTLSFFPLLLCIFHENSFRIKNFVWEKNSGEKEEGGTI